jgi:hypothetical protein
VFSFNNLRRRVSIGQKHHAFSVIIARNNNWTSYIVMLVGFTGCFVWFSSLLVPALFRRPFSADHLYLLFPLAFILLWYTLGLRIALWRSFGVEEVVVENGVLRWTRTVLFWVRKFEITTKDISAVNAVTPWHALSNCVEFTADGRCRTIGDMLLRDEAIEVAERLRQAAGVTRV